MTMQTYVVTTQGLENYGAHTEDGRFESGNACWKFKVGSTYLIEGVHRQADAMAFVQAILYSKRDANGIGWKEFPSTCDTYDGWYDTLDGSEDYVKDFFVRNLIKVNVKELMAKLPADRKI